MKDKVQRKNRTKKLLRWLMNVLLFILLVPASLTFLFKDPVVQTLSAKMLTNLLSKQINRTVEIQALKVDLFSGIEIKGLLLEDLHDNPLIKVGSLVAKPVYADWGMFGLVFSKLEIDDATFTYGRYAGEENYNLTLLLHQFADTTKSRGGGSFKLKTRKLKLTNSRFHLFDENKEYNNGTAMDYADILIDSIQLLARNFKIINDSLNFRIDSLRAREQCGLLINDMSTDFALSSKGLHAQNLLIQVGRSSLDLDLDFNYATYQSYSYFIDSVEMVGDIRPSYLQMDDLGYFAEVMFQMPNRVGLTGAVQGPVSYLSGKDLMVHFGEDTRVHADVSIKGLPDFFTSYMEADFKELSATTCDLRNFGLPIAERNIDLSEQFDCNELFHGTGNFSGYYEDFVTDLHIKSDAGAIDAGLSFTRVEEDTLYFDLTLRGDTVNVGHLVKQEKLFKNMSMDVRLLGHGNSMDDLFVRGKGELSGVDFMKYNYERIGLSGYYFMDSLVGNLRVGDKHLMMNADGYLHLAQTPSLGIQADIVKADLATLKFVPIPGFGIASQANLNLRGFEPETMTADLTLTASRLRFGEDIYHMDSAHLEKTYAQDSIHAISLYSDLADFNLEGKYNVMNLREKLYGLVDHFFDIYDEDTLEKPFKENYVRFEAEIKDGHLIEEQFIPGLFISPETSFHADLDFTNHTAEADFSSGQINYQGIAFYDNFLSVGTKNDRVFADLDNKRIIFKDSTETDKTVFGIDNLSFKSSVGRDSLGLRIYWDNHNDVIQNRGNIEGHLITDASVSNFVISKSDVVINDTLWHIAENNSITKDSSGITFNNIEIFGGDSKLYVNGKYPRHQNDDLEVSLVDWNLSIFDILTRPLNFDLDGRADGFLDFSMIGGKPAVISDLTIRDLQLNKEYLGTTRLMNTWDNTNNSIFVKMQVIKEGSSGKGQILAVDGFYYPFREEESLDLTIAFNRFKLRSLEPFVSVYLTQVEGVAEGNLKLGGTILNPRLTGLIELYRTSLLVNYLNTKYSFSNTVEFKEKEVVFDKLVIYDTLGNSANINGSLQHKRFKNPRFNVKISTDKLLFFNTDRHMNDLYYGTAITSGDIFISGSPQDIALDINVTSQRGTHVYLPMDYSVEISDKDYIIFVKHDVDTLFANLEEESSVTDAKNDKLEYDINLNMKITPAAKVSIALPGDMGSIESEGTGDLRMRTNTKGDFTLVGDYIVSKGLFHFSIGNLVNKRFDLVEGGRISWTGDPYLANLNIRGLYKVKTNLSSLGLQIDSTANYKNKVNVECYVILTNQLLNPDLRFEILMPDLDPDLQRMVYAAMDTTNQAVVNQQMISLLVLGTFSFNNAANVGVNTAYYSVLTNQLSNMLSRISDDFDIGVNYKPGDQITQEEFDVALSTQFFDDRLTIDGNFGMTYDRSQQNASNIVGDVDIGYKLTEDGRWVLKVFNHSNVNSWYNYSSYDKVSPYTQGIGIAFRKEFNQFAELFQRTRPKKEKKDKKEKSE